eukprot:TRINITY_DN2058_c0_g1_i5.p1 TRINITY_DN2058_c0_g1~~TRINITY_DN2058_c0_g1_i5.p1  ORF type:complete len:109 (+),score=23.76 TRINITY_DN2058_c0_g1_i5:371-697(+)
MHAPMVAPIAADTLRILEVAVELTTPAILRPHPHPTIPIALHSPSTLAAHPTARSPPCLLYTSDAADEEDSVDLGGRRIIKKKKKTKYGSDYKRTKHNSQQNKGRRDM